MSESAEQQPFDDAAELEIAAAQAIEACGGDMLATVKALIVANSLLEQELSDVYTRASFGFLRGRRLPKRT
jgi:hypothetical protein